MHVISNRPFDTEMDMFQNSFLVRLFVRKSTETEVSRHNAYKKPSTIIMSNLLVRFVDVFSETNLVVHVS